MKFFYGMRGGWITGVTTGWVAFFYIGNSGVTTGITGVTGITGITGVTGITGITGIVMF